MTEPHSFQLNTEGKKNKAPVTSTVIFKEERVGTQCSKLKENELQNNFLG
jgi:hypothetical protein